MVGELFIGGPADGKWIVVRERVDRVYVPEKVDLLELRVGDDPRYRPPKSTAYTRRHLCGDHNRGFAQCFEVWAPDYETTPNALRMLMENYAPSKKSRPRYPHEKSGEER